MKKCRIRATITSNGVGKQRQGVYAGVMSRVDEAIKSGFYLEAITLLESIISDRLESICNERTESDKDSFNTLGSLIKNARTCIPSEQWNETLKNLFKWRDDRNSALHEMAKIEIGDTSNFDERYKQSRAIAKEGKKLFRAVDNEIRKFRKTIKNS